MKRTSILAFLAAVGIWLALNGVAGWILLPPMLLQAPVPVRTEPEREAFRTRLAAGGGAWSTLVCRGGQARPLRVWRLQRPGSAGVAVLLHGFGDDGWGPAYRLRDLPGWDGALFTFRGRDMDPTAPSTLGAWEGEDAAAVVRALEAHGTPRNRILLVGSSQGAGVALLALRRLEAEGGPLAGALLESPFASLPEAARDHLRGTLGWGELLLRPAERLALWRAGRIAGIPLAEVSPREAARGLRTPVAYLAGDRDGITPLEGVRSVAGPGADLTVVPGADHLEAGTRLPGGWARWAGLRLRAWGLGGPQKLK
ncbi:MAG TPA: alpha/beta fold hydrolase [Holophaga sp.]|nr:alpha/beta fold hydrolase [Holophaga sp.]